MTMALRGIKNQKTVRMKGVDLRTIIFGVVFKGIYGRTD